MRSLGVLISLALYSASVLALVDDPRLAKPEVASCVAQAKAFLSTSEIDDDSEQLELIKACHDVEGACVEAVGSRMVSFERGRLDTLLPVIKACRGRGMAECYKNLADKLPSFETREARQALVILKKCE